MDLDLVVVHCNVAILETDDKEVIGRSTEFAADQGLDARDTTLKTGVKCYQQNVT